MTLVMCFSHSPESHRTIRYSVSKNRYEDICVRIKDFNTKEAKEPKLPKIFIINLWFL